MQLSVVIPTWNTAAMTLACCRAVLAQLPAGSEVIVVDDASTDGTAEQLASELPGVRVVRREVNGGFTAAANDGVAQASGELVMVLNSDAVVQPGAIDALVVAFARDARLGVAGAQLLNPDHTPQWSGGREPTLAWLAGVVSGLGPFTRFFRRGGRPSSVRRVDWVSGAAMMFRASVWRTAGPFDARFRFYCQDLELCTRARDAGWGIEVIDAARVVHQLGGSIAGDDALSHDPARLWCDLFDWASRRYGARWSRLAHPVLVAAAFARVAVRTITLHDRRVNALLRGAAVALAAAGRSHAK